MGMESIELPQILKIYIPMYHPVFFKASSKCPVKEYVASQGSIAIAVSWSLISGSRNADVAMPLLLDCNKSLCNDASLSTANTIRFLWCVCQSVKTFWFSTANCASACAGFTLW